MNDSELTRKVKAVALHVKQALSGGGGVALPILDPWRWKGVCGQRQAAAGLFHGKGPGSWVGHGTGLDGSGKSCLHVGSNPVPSSPYRAAIRITPSRPPNYPEN